MNNWPTKYKDLHTAQQIMETYAREQKTTQLGLFELTVDKEEKKLNLRLSSWVINLAQHFIEQYGTEEGEKITRRVITSCLIQEQTLH